MKVYVCYATEDLVEIARRMDGFYAGQFKPHEYEHLMEAGLLRFSYAGVSGFLGLATLRFVQPPKDEDES